jgi:NADH:ubiquinone oxidoreductase subunit 4 (subunit M)
MSLFTNPIIFILSSLSLGLLFLLLLRPESIVTIQRICLTTSFLALNAGMALCLLFNRGATGYQFLYNADFLPQLNITFALGVDSLSLVFLILTLFIFPVLFLASWSLTKEPKQFFCHLLGIELLLALTFTVVDLFYFFILFESLLIPMFIIIGFWGARNRKIKAAYYFLLFTL